MKEVDAALFQKLRDSVVLQNLGVTLVRRHNASPTDVEPYVIFAQQSENRTYVFSRLAYIDLVYQVKAVQARGSALEAQEIDEAIDVLLTDQPLTVDGFAVSYLRRESGFELDEVQSGQSYDTVGGMYRIHLVPVPMATPRIAGIITLANA